MRNKWITIISVILILLTTFAYSALSTSLAITSDAKVKALADIRFSNIRVKSASGGVISYEPEYGIDNLTTGFNLTDSNSTITYTATVANNGDYDYIIYNSSITSSNNPGITYSTSYLEDNVQKTDLSKHIIESHDTFTFDITFTGAAGNSNVITGFTFKKLYRIIYDLQGGSSSESDLINGQYKIEDVDLTLTDKEPTKSGSIFSSWNTSYDGTGISYIPSSVMSIDPSNPTLTLYAQYSQSQPSKTFNYLSNEGEFEDSSETKSIKYTYSPVIETRYSHTSNISDAGVAIGNYPNGTSVNDKVTIPGAKSLNIELWYSTEGADFDWLAIYPNGVTPDDNNYNLATISSGKLGGGKYTTKPSDDDPTYHTTYTVEGDTAQFYFRSDVSENYYGYYAVITASIDSYTSDKTYEEPTRTGYTFIGWNTAANGSGTSYLDEEEVLSDFENLPNQANLYAQYLENKHDKVVNYKSNEGIFDNNETTYSITYSYSSDTVTRYSHTSNINDQGVPSGNYPNGASVNDVVTIPGADSLNIELWYATEGSDYDWLAIYPNGVTPDDNNYNLATISGGKLAGGRTTTKPSDDDENYHRTFTVEGNTVQFYFRSDGSENFYGYYAVVTGVVSGYSGNKTYKEPSKGGATFTGWNTAANGSGTSYLDEDAVLYNIESLPDTIDLYAIYYDPCNGFSTDSWSTIKTNLESNSSYYAVGCTKNIQMDMDNNGVNETYALRLSNTSTPSSCSTSGYSQTACGPVIEFVDILEKHNINNVSSNDGGYAESDVATYLNSTFYNKLPSDLKSIIIPTGPIVSGSGSGGVSTDITLADTDKNKIYLLSTREVGIDGSYDNKKDTTTDTRTLDYYSTNTDKSYRIKKYDDTNTTYWLRSAVSNTSDCFSIVNHNGDGPTQLSNVINSEGISPAFRIGTQPAPSYYVTFDTDGGSSIERQVVMSGHTATRPSSNPTKDGYRFINYYADSTYQTVFDFDTLITGPTTIYVKFQYIDPCNNFGTDSWSDIKDNLERNSSYYPIGCEKEVPMDMDNNGVDESYTVRLTNTSNPSVCETNGYSQTACGTVIEFVDMPTKHEMNSSSTNYGGYASSDMVTYLNDTFYNKLPSSLKSVIIPTYPIVSGSGSGGVSENITENDTDKNKIYLLSTREVGIEGSYDNKKDTSTDTRTLDYYVTNAGASYRKKLYDDYYTTYWLRSATSIYGDTFAIVNHNGDGPTQFSNAINPEGVAPAFRIGTVANPKYTVSFNPNGGSVSPESVEIDPGDQIGELPTPKPPKGFIFDAWYTGISTGVEVTSSYTPQGNIEIFARYTAITPVTCSNNQNITVGNGTICKRATTLHREQCTQSGTQGYYCDSDGYTTNGSQGTDIITYGNCGTDGVLITGDAFTCDVNGDGNFDEAHERFYYVSDYYNTSTKTTNNNYAVLVYSSNTVAGVPAAEGEAYDDTVDLTHEMTNYNGPITAVGHLPSSSSWDNVSLVSTNRQILTETGATTINGVTLPVFDYSANSSRLLTYQETYNGCYDGTHEITTNGGLSSKCNFLFEETKYASDNNPTEGPWLETPFSTTSYSAYNVYGSYRGLDNNYVDTHNTYGVRPVIEVPKTSINYGAYYITFDANEGTVSEESRVVAKNHEIGQLPTPTKSNSVFDGWYTALENGTLVEADTVVNSDMHLYAIWAPANAVAEINGTYYTTFKAAITAVQPGETTTIRMLKSTTESVDTTLASGTDVILDLRGFTITNTATNVLKNDGEIYIKNGNIVCTTSQGALNNNKNAIMTLDNVTVSGTGTKQAVYNKGGDLTIKGGSTLSTTSTSQRAALHNLNDGSVIGKTTILDATIISPNNSALYIESGHVIIGNNDGKIEVESPLLQGYTYGVEATGTFEYYDGILKGSTAAISNESKMTDTEDDSEFLRGNETITGTPYYVIFLVSTVKYSVTLNPNGGTVSPPLIEVDPGDQVGELPIPTKPGHTFIGWYTGISTGVEVTSTYEPEGNIEIFARYYKDVTGATITPPLITLEPTQDKTITITDVEEGYTFTSNDTSIATVDNNGNVTAIALGTTAITITGTRSNKTVTVEVDVVEEVYYKITLDPNGGEVDPTEISVEADVDIGNLPIPTKLNSIFDGWYTALEGGTLVTAETEIDDNVKYFAHWAPLTTIAEMNGDYYSKLQSAVSAANSVNQQDTIRLLANTSEVITTSTDNNIILDLQNFTLSNSGNNNVIKNNGTLTLVGGTITSNTSYGAVDNNSTGTFNMTGGRIIATGARQGIYNDGGSVTISGDAYISSSAPQRSALHNKSNGTVNITGGTIVSTTLYAVYNESGTVNIGIKGGSLSTTSPVIQGNTYGVVANSTYNFYDGIIRGVTYPVGIATTGNTPTITIDTDKTKINEIETNTKYVESTEDIENVTYNTLYLALDDTYEVRLNANGGSVSPAKIDVEKGSQIGTIPTPTPPAGKTFIGWYTGISTGVEVTSSYTPTEDIEIFARYYNDISGATISPSSIEINIGEQETITVSNLEEQYSFSSSNNSIATVNSSGVVTGVSLGSATITITGTSSNKTRTINVSVVTPTYTITADPNGGSITSTDGWTGTGNSSTKSISEDGTYGNLPNASKSNYVLKGWTLLPAGYTPVDYIEGNGNQYILTNITPSDNFTLKAKIYLSESNGGGEQAFAGTSNNPIEYFFDGSQIYLWAQTSGTSYYVTGPSNQYNKIVEYEATNDSTGLHLTVDGTTYNNANIFTGGGSLPLTIFGYHKNSTGSYPFKGRIYSLQTYDAGVLTSYFIPCINDTTGKAGLYDLVSDTFYGSNTSTEFASSGEGEYIQTTDQIMNVDHTITAVWGPMYTITANPNGGTIASTDGWTGTGNSSTKSISEDGTYGTLPSVSKTGYALSGWTLLPVGYKPVKYIEADGNQYILTNITPSSNFTLKAKVYLSDTKGGGEQAIAGTSNNPIEYYFDSSQLKFWARNGGTSYNVLGPSNQYNKVVEYEATNDSTGLHLTVDGTTYNNSNVFTGGGSLPLTLFGYNNNGIGSYTFRGRIYSLQTYSNSVLTSYFIPCINETTGKAGLYDIVGETFYGSNTNTDFIASTEGEYIKTTDQIINSNHTITAVWNSKYTITLNPTDGSVSSTSMEVNVGSEIGTIPTPTPPEGYLFDNWYTDPTNGDLVDSSYVPTGNITIYARYNASRSRSIISSSSCPNNDISVDSGIVCKRATELHTEECTQSGQAGYYCNSDGYSSSNNITYGNCGTSGVLSTGDAFTCDVNGDGDFDEVDERFYYVSDYFDTSTNTMNNNYAVLIYYKNVVEGGSSLYGEAYDDTVDLTSTLTNYNGPLTAMGHLPSSGLWNNVSLLNTNRQILTDAGGTTVNGVTLPVFSYSGKTSRLLTYQELYSGCYDGVNSLTTTGGLSSCNFLFEGTKYASDSNPTEGPWLETPFDSTSYSAYNIYGSSRGLDNNYVDTHNSYGVRPVIEVEKSSISYGNNQLAKASKKKKTSGEETLENKLRSNISLPFINWFKKNYSVVW